MCVQESEVLFRHRKIRIEVQCVRQHCVLPAQLENSMCLLFAVLHQCIELFLTQFSCMAFLKTLPNREMRWNELLLFTSICRISRLRCTAAYRLQERIFSEGSVYCNKIATYIENAVVSWIEKIYVNLPMCFKAVRSKQLAYYLRGLSGCVLYFPHNYDMIGLFLAGLNFLLPQSHS